MKEKKSIVKSMLYLGVSIASVIIIVLLLSILSGDILGDNIFKCGILVIIAGYFYAMFKNENVDVAKKYIIGGCLIMFIGYSFT